MRHQSCGARRGEAGIRAALRNRTHMRWKEHVLAGEMDPDLKALFTQPEKVCERYLKEFEQIMDFQEKHRQHLCAYELEETTNTTIGYPIFHKGVCFNTFNEVSGVRFSSTVETIYG
ncbi:hypothetical protein scyTo_0012297 [Scyliorhinus torazame]|uniref:Uncharacterized protein n=1 Tax=Scyliorhinus torazame TaxID=75743 RepID=A0A401P602_SCYTO|nr:hypothetical protein [Scyliorhinus torazame]